MPAERHKHDEGAPFEWIDVLRGQVMEAGFDESHAPLISGPEDICNRRRRGPGKLRDGAAQWDGGEAQRSETSWAASAARLFLAGGCAGAVSKTATAPLARLTILYQLQGMTHAAGKAAVVRDLEGLGVWGAMGRIVRDEGVRSLWRGNLATVIHRFPYSAVNFFIYEEATKVAVALQARYVSSAAPAAPGATAGGAADVARRGAVGCVSGMLACLVAYPLDLVRTRLAASSGRSGEGIASTLRGLVREAGGLRGLYQGAGITMVQVGPSLTVTFSVYESLRAEYLRQRPGQDSPPTLVAQAHGGLSGFASTALTFPLDTVRRRVQMAARDGSGDAGALAAARNIVRDAGLRALYRGFLPECLKVVPGSALGFAAYELAKDVMGVQEKAHLR